MASDGASRTQPRTLATQDNVLMPMATAEGGVGFRVGERTVRGSIWRLNEQRFPNSPRLSTVNQTKHLPPAAFFLPRPVQAKLAGSGNSLKGRLICAARRKGDMLPRMGRCIRHLSPVVSVEHPRRWRNSRCILPSHPPGRESHGCCTMVRWPTKAVLSVARSPTPTHHSTQAFLTIRRRPRDGQGRPAWGGPTLAGMVGGSAWGEKRKT
ncbi:hypothetical protein MAPG_10397 [Magnaporthiopsis poae ATCC 64411]|uniref:Uncharacterized protein n=1 Tax=Magnaporthiopsis poae (strain ATCC 64411 / 73-15) TaxID=644358 RepID=A0A0C4ECH3_MAGP6|nr:hypothetical protein MAPG_10397 [Magnaporthiopsis poae ATCC 64411]